jgi:hypothetical protein
MNKLARTAFVAPLAAVLAFSATPSHAAERFTILAGGTSPYSPLRLAFKPSGCNASLVSSPLNGIDSKIVSAAPYAGKNINVSWSATFDVAGSTGVAFLFSSWNGACNENILTGVNGGSRTWRIAMPADAKWIAVQTTVSANLEVTITVVP